MPFDPQGILSEIDRLDFAPAPTGRYLNSDNNSVLCLWSTSIARTSEIRFGKTRRSALPQVEENGNFSDLNIPQHAGLSELIHVVFFPDGVVGADYNHHAPRISALPYYLKSKADVNPSLQFQPLLRPDILEQLDRFQRLSLMRIRIKPSLVELIKKADTSLGAAFEASQSMSQAKSLEIIIQPDKNDGRGLLSRMRDVARHVLPRIENIEKKGADLLNFELKGYDSREGRTTSIDLLQAHLLTSKKIMTQDGRSRALNKESAFQAIQTAYEELQSQIQAAHELVLLHRRIIG